MYKFKLMIIFSMITGSILLYGQEIHSALQLRNNHLWRGIEVASGLVYTGDIHLDYKNFYGGFWAGGTANGDYKEFNNYIGYKNKHLTLELWDIYNFSPNATYNNKEFFNYNARETGRFMDFRSYYTISDRIPLILSWNTVISGRDRNKENTHNKYSTFVFAEYPVYKKDDLEVRGRLGYICNKQSRRTEQLLFEEGRFQRNQPYDIEAFVNRQLQDPARIMGNVESSR